MEQNWDVSDDPVMDDPLGGIKRGWSEISGVYERLFRGAHRYHCEFYDYTLRQYGEIFIAIGHERGELMVADSSRLDLAIRKSRIFHFHLVKDRWHQLHHHGSIDDAAMLARYRQAVFNASG